MVPIYVCIIDTKIFFFSKKKTNLILVYRDHCHLFASESFLHGLIQIFQCSPAVFWFTSLSVLHILWTSSLCITILLQVKSYD